MSLLLLNAIKGLRYKKVQMFGIIFCIILSTAIFTSMNTSLDRMEDRYKNYLIDQNVEDFSFVPKIDYSKDYTKQEVQDLLKNELKDLPDSQLSLVKQYYTTIGINNIPNIQGLYSAIDYIFNTNGANNKKLLEKINDTKLKYDFEYENQLCKVSTIEKNIFKSILYDKDSKIDLPYVIEGRMPELKNEITLLPVFAKSNNIKLNDDYKIGDITYKVVGFVYSPEHIFPLMSFNRPIFNEKTDTVIYMNKETFENFNGIKELNYVAAFNDKSKNLEVEVLQEMFKQDENIKLSPTVFIKLLRVNTLSAEIKNDRVFSEYFLYLLLGISIFIILVITKKRIEEERLQIGVLKSLGYSSIGIATSYLVYPIVGSIIGCLIGYFIGIFAQQPLTNVFVSYFNLPLEGYEFTFKYLYNSLILTLSTLCVLTLVISLFMLRKKPLELLKEGSNLKVNMFSKFVAFITRKLNFKTRFKLSLASRSIGKLFVVTVTSFCTGLLIVLVLIGMNMFDSMINKTFGKLKYDNMISYNKPLEGSSDTEDLFYNISIDMVKVEKSNGDISEIKNRNGKDKLGVNLFGIDSNLKLIEISDYNKNDISKLIKNDEDIIINKNIKEIIEADINDFVIFKSGDKEYKFKIVGIEDSFMGLACYAKREYISNLFDSGLKYNVKYTNDDKYDKLSNLDKTEMDNIVNIFGVSDLKENMQAQMSASNGAIYFVIAFASVLALIVILVIANVIIEENKKTISLMKVMGYKNKEISQIVLNIYTPFVIISYLLAIPVMKEILSFIVKVLTKDIDIAIPIELSLTKALIGLLGLLIAYYTAIIISKNTLNKVPLSVALKRE
jgi:putative ABC transport system permease protein